MPTQDQYETNTMSIAITIAKHSLGICYLTDKTLYDFEFKTTSSSFDYLTFRDIYWFA